jgi:hypothetical protein
VSFAPSKVEHDDEAEDDWMIVESDAETGLQLIISPSLILPNRVDAMLAVIIHQRYSIVRQFFSIEECLTFAGQAIG